MPKNTGDDGYIEEVSDNTPDRCLDKVECLYMPEKEHPLSCTIYETDYIASKNVKKNVEVDGVFPSYRTKFEMSIFNRADGLFMSFERPRNKRYDYGYAIKSMGDAKVLILDSVKGLVYLRRDKVRQNTKKSEAYLKELREQYVIEGGANE